MMSHMLDALDNGEDIGHYGRLVFAMIGRHFVTNDELVELLTKDHDADQGEIRALVKQVEEKGYSPPRREKILEYQSQQAFRSAPTPTTLTLATLTRSCSSPTKSTRQFKSIGKRGGSALAVCAFLVKAECYSGEVV